MSALSFLLGRCIPCVKQHASKICFTTMEFDSNLNMYFKKYDSVFAHDPDKICKTGDVVLIEKLEKKLTPIITHKVIKIVYPMGDITDPITGKKVSSTSFRDDIEEVNELYGRSELAFNYKKAPPRGWQEGKKDFTDKETYLKIRDTGEDQPYSY